MKIAVFGSTGKAGQEVVTQALDRGFRVAAYAREPSKLSLTSPRLTVIGGELNDKIAIDRAAYRANAAISLLGPGGNPKDDALSEGVKNIVAALGVNRVSRFIQISTPSSPDPLDQKDLKIGAMVRMAKNTIPNAYKEIVRIGEIVRSSDLDWTLVRVPLLNEKPLTKKLRIGYPGEKIVKTAVSRADLAWFMLEQLTSNEYLKKAPMISN
ncbi:MAG: NAD(P)H-binding protein [Clostridiales Family XIII bacterium]|jgi:putative NADH-flavin reductase|nr:NAD(P)H-binding protein [Clostridiales Family XIII bacterium]